jgi:hypothetical protein
MPSLVEAAINRRLLWYEVAIERGLYGHFKMAISRISKVRAAVVLNASVLLWCRPVTGLTTRTANGDLAAKCPQTWP